MTPKDLSRRGFLGGVGAAAAAAGLGPGCAPRVGTDGDPIEHIVFVMMENRSFDHYLGALQLHEGRDDVAGLMAGHENPGPNGPVPVHRATHWCVPDPPHSWHTSRQQWNDGANDGFVQVHVNRHGPESAAIPMGYFTREELPVTYALSDAYTTCDRWFCSLLAGTWPNRLYSLGGQSQGQPDNSFPQQSLDFSMATVFDQLDEAGRSWSYYYSVAPFAWLFDRFRARDEVRMVEEFFDDCRRGTLPSVSWIDPAFFVNCDHAPAHPQMGQLFFASIHEALAASPAWGKTLLILTYDEHGGFFDHVPPPTVPDDREAEGFGQLGFRVPTLVVGPWARRGHVSHVTYDHTSPLVTIQDRFGLDRLTSRNAAANGLEDTLDWHRLLLRQPAPPARLPVLDLDEDEILEQCRGSAGATGQPELEALLEATGAPAHIDRRAEKERLAAWFLEEGERLGACRLHSGR